MANIITILRIIGMGPLFVLILKNGANMANFIFFTILGLTDFLDGFIARKFNQVTNFGKIADGIADKLLMFSVSIALILNKTIPYWTLIIFIREIISLIYAGFYIKKKNIIVKPSIYGKLKTTFHIISVALVLLLGKWNLYSEILLIISIILFIPEFINRLRNKVNNN